MSACADPETLAALCADTLDPDQRSSILDHAASCEPCHALIAELVVGDPDMRMGRYEIGERLGAGGMGIVYAAIDTELRRRVAVKVMRHDGQGELGSEGRERLMREARVLASLSHPNVVTVFDVGTHDDDLFIAMELVDGGSLTAWLQREPRTLAEVLARLTDAARGLGVAHAAGIVHRDVKPDNVLVGGDGRARVTDFGLARIERSDGEATPVGGILPTTDLTRTGTRMGTPVYMAPEQLATGETSPRADQWSFCAMAYEVLAGVRPFPATDAVARTAAIGAGRLAPGRAVAPWLLDIITRGLRANPADRWPSMDAIVEALERGQRRNTRRAIAIGAAAVVLASVGVAFAVRGGAASEPPVDIVLPDPRPGCHCPLSACDETCASVCRATAYRVGAPLPGISLPDRQEVLLGISSDGNTVLYLANTGCVVDHLWLARREGDTYVPRDLSDKLDRTRVRFFEGCCTLAADGKSMLLARPDQRGFVHVALDGDEPRPVAPADDIATLVPADPKIIARWPVLSPDERTLYYHVYDTSAGPNDAGPLDGNYATTRADVASPFAPGTRLPGRARYYDYVSGVSSDHLSLFMESEYRTHVLVRASVDKPFTAPEDNMLPATLPGFRAAPLADCRRIATTATPGGCAAEDIVWLDAIDP